MDYEIQITVKEIGGDEIYRRQVALPEQMEMLRQDVERAIDENNEKLEE